MSYLQASMGGGSSSLAGLDDTTITTPQDGDILVYDGNTNKWINSEPVTTITLTINSAKEDTVTIKDANNNTVSTCIFTSGATSGACTFDINPGETYTFISSIATVYNGSTFVNYSKNVILNKTSTLINLFPDNTIYWYGNEIISCTPIIYADQSHVTLTKNTNNLTNIYTGTNDGTYKCGFEFNSPFNISGMTKAIMISYNGSVDCCITGTGTRLFYVYPPVGEIKSQTSKSISYNYSVDIRLRLVVPQTAIYYALWFE